jgi:hypothetical protein
VQASVSAWQIWRLTSIITRQTRFQRRRSPRACVDFPLPVLVPCLLHLLCTLQLGARLRRRKSVYCDVSIEMITCCRIFCPSKGRAPCASRCDRAGVRLTGTLIEYDVVDGANAPIFRNIHLPQFVLINEPLELMNVPRP